ncbi:GMC family oxidoreductase [Dactylosporangium sp. CA-092794]|uniref:GMC family oxidoreductase n=1 Tax=Dactylosporangium sp. CA-092794 TaxID=3239929 RepID=UPI003D92A99B
MLAAELSRDAAVKVLLLEAGTPGRGPLFRIPAASLVTQANGRFSYAYRTEPYGSQGREDRWLRGRVLGGTSAINGSMYNRGCAADWDALPGTGWAWNDILPIFRELEDHQLGATDLRGTGGPLGVSVQNNGEPVNEAFIEAAGKRGLARVEDVNEGGDERVGYTPATIARGVRQSAKTAFLRPAMKRANLTVRTGATVTRVLIERDRAVGVLVGEGAAAQEIRATKEVVLSTGGVETPKLLELSGIGDGALLRRLGIEVVLDRPTVGENVVEHHVIPLLLRLNRPGLGYNRMLGSAGGVLRVLTAYLVRRDGFLAAPGAQVLGFARTEPSEPRPDAQIFMNPVSADMERMRLETSPGATIIGEILRPEARGRQHITSADPRTPPRIVPNHLAEDADRRRTVAMLRRMRDIAAEEPLAGMIEGETAPGPGLRDDEGLLDYALNHSIPGYHTVGGCAMGTGDDAVLDTRLRVRGIGALRVMDASALPVTVSGNPNAPLLAMATLAARRILADS